MSQSTLMILCRSISLSSGMDTFVSSTSWRCYHVLSIKGSSLECLYISSSNSGHLDKQSVLKLVDNVVEILSDYFGKLESQGGWGLYIDRVSWGLHCNCIVTESNLLFIVTLSCYIPMTRHYSQYCESIQLVIVLQNMIHAIPCCLVRNREYHQPGFPLHT